MSRIANITRKALPVMGSAFLLRSGIPEGDSGLFMTLGAVTLNGEGGLAVVAGATGFALGHISHGHPLASTIREGFGVAVRTFVRSGMEVMAEIADHGTAAVFEGQVGRFVARVTLVTVTG